MPQGTDETERETTPSTSDTADLFAISTEPIVVRGSESDARPVSLAGPNAFWRGKPLRNLERIIVGLFHCYPNRNLFIAGLPKSGTTWLHRMVSSIPGYRSWSPPGISWSDHTVDAPSLIHPPLGYTATKLHSCPTAAHLKLFNETLKRPYVVIYRDLRDVAVSWYFFAHGVSEGPYAQQFKDREIEPAIEQWIDEKLLHFIRWIDGWRAGADPRFGRIVRYEDLMADTFTEFKTICDHYRVGQSDEVIRRIVERHSFRNATGRSPGTHDDQSFNRKGIVGDWRNHFTPRLKEKFKAIAGDALVRHGYAEDDGW